MRTHHGRIDASGLIFSSRTDDRGGGVQLSNLIGSRGVSRPNVGQRNLRTSCKARACAILQECTEERFAGLNGELGRDPAAVESGEQKSAVDLSCACHSPGFSRDTLPQGRQANPIGIRVEHGQAQKRGNIHRGVLEI